jgi:hypothetical protein
MRPLLLIGLAAAVALSGCQTFPIQLRSTLTKEELQPWGEGGDRFIAGEAFRRQAGGGVVTCAGETVYLLPSVKVSEEAVKIWRAGDEIYTTNLEYANVSGSVRWTECDKDGNFAFFDLAPRKYLVFVKVTWHVGKKEFGGMLFERVSLKSGSAERLILDADDKFYDAEPWELTPHFTRRPPCPCPT